MMIEHDGIHVRNNMHGGMHRAYLDACKCFLCIICVAQEQAAVPALTGPWSS